MVGVAGGNPATPGKKTKLHIETILIFFVLIVENKYPFHNLFL